VKLRLAVLAIALGACAGVLGLRKPATSGLFPHRAHVVAGVSCVRCHAGVEQAADEGPLHVPDDASCASCHEPHAKGSCLGCHGDAFATAAVIDARTHLRFAHRDHAQSSGGGCVTCHRGVAEGDGPLRPTMSTCWGCHDAEQDARTCDACHVDLEEEGTLPESHLVHDGDWIREHGTRASSAGDLCGSCHTERSCAACHGQSVAELPSTMRFDQPTRASVHRAGFASRHAIEARAEPGACATCHAPSTCQSCHAREGVADLRGSEDGSPHPAGWVGLTSSENEHGRAARRDPAACASCHGGAGEQLCVGCHRVGGVGGSPHPPGWSSRQAFTDLPCRLCHESAR
jgi:hypothetical protein